MKTIKRLGSAVLMAFAALGVVSAQDIYRAGETFNLLQQPASSSVARTPQKAQRTAPLQLATQLYEEDATILPGALTISNDARASVKKAAASTVKASLSELTGEWIMSYDGAASTSPTGGDAVTISKSAQSDTIYIEGFWSSSVTLYGFYQEATGCITIPWQKIATSTYYGALNIGMVNASTGGRISGQDVTIEANGDGTLSIQGIWGMFITSGDYSGNLMDAFYNTTFEKGNSTMTYTSSGATYTYPIVATQSSPNTVSIKNFRNLGRTVDVYLNRDKSAVIKSQIGYQASASMNYYTVGNVVLDESGYPTSWEDDIQIAASDKKNEFNFSNWSMIYGSKYWIGYMGETTISLPFDVVYPEQLASTEFDGKGTKESPYLIKSYDDLELLGDKVLAAEYNATTGEGDDATEYARAFMGSYFRLTADIDLANRRFSPIGDATHHFAGTFDGDGHTISNLYITTDDRYAAFFAKLDTLSDVENLSFNGAYVYSSSSMPSVLTTESYGVIKNCTVNDAYVQSPSQGATALAAIANVVEGCSVTNSTVISAQGFCGTLVAQLTGSMSNCFASNIQMIVAVSATTIPPVGGLVGASNSSPIDNCYFNGEIYGLNSSYPCRMGGITGAAGSGAVITNCFTNATLLPVGHSSQYTGGIAAYFYGSMSNCYATGSIYSSQSAITGGLTGATLYRATTDGTAVVAVFDNCYSAVDMTALTTDYDAENEMRELFGSFSTANPPSVSSCYYDKQLTSFGSKHGATTAELTAAAGPEGFNSSAWTFTAGSYPRLKATANSGAARMGATALVMPEGSTFARCTVEPTYTELGETKVGFLVNGEFSTKGKYATAENGTIKFNTENAYGVDSLMITGDGMTFYHPINILPIKFEGQGTAESPFLIQNKADLIALSKMTSESAISYADMYFKMTADIDLEYDTEFKGLAVNTKTSVTFKSVFDGDGHTIHNMRINNIVWTVKPEDDPEGYGTVDTSTNVAAYNGFVGRLAATGVIRNLTLAADCDIQAFASTGAFAGLSNGLVENCYNYANVTGQSSWIGGLVGQANQGAVIRNSYNAGKVKSGYRNAGGIVGSNHGTVENCVNVGDVEVTPGYKKLGSNGLKYAGGITGGEINGIIINCLNTGAVYASEGNAGGISGSTPKNLTSTTAGSGTNDIISSISYGVVGCGDLLTTGAISGEAGSVGSISGNVWDVQILPIGAFANGDREGCTGVSTAALTSAAGISGFDTQYWQFADGSYPVLKTFADNELLKAAASIVVKFDDADNALNLKKSATLSAGTTWSLKQGTVYSISGNTLNVPETLPGIVLDTLVAVNGSITKEIPLRSIVELTLNGKGTEENPYLINNATDWNSLANYMENTGNDFTGSFFKLTADIDFSGTVLSPIGMSPVYFNATLDGDNHSIGGYDLTDDQAYLAPVNVVDAKGVVKNIVANGKVSSAYSTNTKSYTAGLVAKLYGAIDNCELTGTVSAVKGYVGGLVASAYTGASVTNCRNRGVVSGASYLGGIAAYCEANVLFDNCNNEGTFVNVGTSTTLSNYIGGIIAYANESTFTNCYNKAKYENISNAGYIGGIVAYAYGAKDANYYVFKNCYNAADIDARSEVGGIIGYSTTTVGAAVMQIDSCYNTGNLHTTVASNYMGGIIARYKPGSTISNCWNSGDITSDKGSFIGGIAGSTNGAPTSEYPVVITGCENTGTITALGYGAGGIVGNLNTYCTVEQCVNKGRVEGTYGLGGIVSALYGATGQVVECLNLGDVTATMNRAGGIVGYNGASGGASSVISGCVNLGNVKTTCTTKGTETKVASPSGFAIGGIVGLSPATIENCANYGTVTGASRVGGIVGQSVKDKTQINGCYNAGKLVCDAEDGGNVIGIPLTDATLWTTKNSTTGTYYLDENGVLGNDNEAFTSVSRAQLAKLNMGDAWEAGDDYSFPVAAGFADNDAALLYAAQVIPAEGETLSTISHDFKVGNPEGIKWTATPEGAVEFSGNDARLATNASGDVVLTATLGDYSRQETIKVTSVVGISNIYGDKEIASEEYFDVNGMRVSKPQAADGRIYIVRLRYTNGSSEIVKVLNDR